MRYLVALGLAIVATALLFVGGARIAQLVSGPERTPNDFTVGARFDLCGYSVDSRHELAGYALKDWQGERCRNLSKLDHCVLGCLQEAPTVEVAASCYEACVERR